MEDREKSRAAAVEAAKELVNHLKAAYPHRVDDSIKQTCDLYVRHVLESEYEKPEPAEVFDPTDPSSRMYDNEAPG